MLKVVDREILGLSNSEFTKLTQNLGCIAILLLIVSLGGESKNIFVVTNRSRE